jgi:hypothetical protein
MHIVPTSRDRHATLKREASRRINEDSQMTLDASGRTLTFLENGAVFTGRVRGNEEHVVRSANPEYYFMETTNLANSICGPYPGPLNGPLLAPVLESFYFGPWKSHSTPSLTLSKHTEESTSLRL